MKAENFKDRGVFHGGDLVLTAPPSLPVQRRDGICTSCWRMSLRERLAVLFGSKIYIHVASGRTQPPISLTVE